MMEESVISGSVNYDANTVRTETIICIWYAIMSLSELKIFYDGTVEKDFSM